MSAQPSPNLNLTQLRLQARELLRAHRDGESDALERIEQHHPRLSGSTAEKIVGHPLVLADAQLVIARENGFPSWTKLKQHTEATRKELTPFDQAVQSIIHRNAVTLRHLLSQEPELIRVRSASSHRSALLHYVAANGVESELQESPPNAVEVAQILLDAGAEVDATAEFYGGGPQQTTMNALVTSVWPYLAGVQVDLVNVLLDAGAAIDGLVNDGSPVRGALKFGYVDAARTLERRGCRIDRLDVASGLGRVDLMESILGETGREQEREVLESSFKLACGNGQIEAAGLLLQHGVGIDWQLEGQGTGLHQAILHGEGGEAQNGRLDMVRFLIESGADQNVRHGKYDATAIDFASYNGRTEIVEYLVSQGATDVDEALDGAARQGHPDTAKILLQAGAKPRQVTLADLEADEKMDMVRLLRG